jgi:hypothetical protein
VQGVRKALQLAFDPPLAPRQLQFQGPDPLTALALPELQRLLVGALAMVAPCAEPQMALVAHVEGSGGLPR